MDEPNVRFLGEEERAIQNTALPTIEEGSYYVRYDDSPFMFASNFPCPICRQRTALFNTSKGIFEPCFECGSKGYILIHINTQRKWWQFWKYFGIYNHLFERIEQNQRNTRFYSTQ